MRNFNIIKQLLKHTHVNIEVFAVASKDSDPEAMAKKFESQVNARCHVVSQPSFPISTFRSIFINRVPPFMDAYQASGIGEIFRKACEASLPDIVHIEQPHAYYCIKPHIQWLKEQGVKIVFDCHNIEFRLLEDSLRLHSLPKKIVGKLLIPSLKRMEIEATKNADVVLVCSTADANFFKQYNAKTYIIPNGVDCSQFEHPSKSRSLTPTLIFMGGVGYPPNGDALKFYLKSIHAKIKEQIPNIKLLAIGADKKWLTSIGIDDPSIDPLGFVDDTRPYLATATIGICPIRYGSGTRIKIMTYMAADLPVVSTQKGAEGVAYTDGHDILMADEPENFATAILKLLNDSPYREKIARNGKKFILQNYDWDIIGKDLDLALQAAL
jgi:glycosyltransferase involved in cell wall biosynthesis